MDPNDIEEYRYGISPASPVAQRQTATAPEDAGAPLPQEPEAQIDAGPEKKQSDLDKRIAKLTYEREEAKRQAAYWQGKSEAGMAQPADHGVQDRSQVFGVEPKQEDFETYDDYIRAIAKHEIAPMLQNERQKYHMEQEQNNIDSAFQGRLIKAREKYTDFDAIAGKEDLDISQQMGEAVMRMQDGADILHYLGSAPEQATRISRMSPYDQMLEIGKISARLAFPGFLASSPPNPISPIKGPSISSSGKDPNRIEGTGPASDAEWFMVSKRRRR